MLPDVENETAVRATADVFNSTVASWAIAAAWELGALDELNEKGSLNIDDFAARNNLHTPSTTGMFAAMNSVNVVERDGQAVVVGANFAEVFRTKSFFHWLVRGCSELFTQMPSVLRNENRIGRYYRRDPKAISFACRDINAKCFDPAFWTGMENLDYSFSVVADLGCGSGERLIQLAERYPGTKGIGLDNAGPSLETAASDVAAAGLTDRITFGELDVRSMAPRQEFDEVDLLTCFMMGHDFWPRESCVATLRRLRELFPNARRMLLGDKTRTVGVPDGEQEIFTLGFEVAHAMMNVYIPTLEEWEGVFGDGGWKCVRKTTVQGLASSVVFELE